MTHLSHWHISWICWSSVFCQGPCHWYRCVPMGAGLPAMKMRLCNRAEHTYTFELGPLCVFVLQPVSYSLQHHSWSEIQERWDSSFIYLGMWQLLTVFWGGHTTRILWSSYLPPTQFQTILAKWQPATQLQNILCFNPWVRNIQSCTVYNWQHNYFYTWRGVCLLAQIIMPYQEGCVTYEHTYSRYNIPRGKWIIYIFEYIFSQSRQPASNAMQIKLSLIQKSQ